MAITKINHPDLLELDSSTGATVFPKGTTAQRPVSPEAGYIRFNTTDNVVETYDGTEWLTLDTIVSPPYSVDYLVVAGGGCGGAGGAGAGGLRTSFGTTSGGGCVTEDSIILNRGTSYSVIVGAGGAGLDGGQNGFNSSLSIITSIGGGRSALTPLGGGSGAGAYYGGVPSSGTSCQGYNGGNMTTDNANWTNFGGGGGAGQVGGNAQNIGGSAGKGGDGLESSITGSAIYYAGGGGGGVAGAGSTPGVGGLGGGGYGSAGNPGVTNTGGGGGGSSAYNIYNQGGSGIVILRMPTANYSGTTTGSPTVTTDGSDTILTYTSSGTYTA